MPMSECPMTMNSSYCASIVAAIILLQLLFVYPSATSREMLQFEEMTMLGSRPPTCHNKCNSCHPCMAVQVTAQSGLSPVQSKPGSGQQTVAVASTYSNYKPLGWKCMCKDHIFNP